MDTKLFLCALLYSLFSVVNSLAIEYGNVDINTIDSNVKYSKKISYSTKNKGRHIFKNYKFNQIEK